VDVIEFSNVILEGTRIPIVSKIADAAIAPSLEIRKGGATKLENGIDKRWARSARTLTSDGL
jgi:hypothetical protein